MRASGAIQPKRRDHATDGKRLAGARDCQLFGSHCKMKAPQALSMSIAASSRASSVQRMPDLLDWQAAGAVSSNRMKIPGSVVI
jgi:hypothetical protein